MIKYETSKRHIFGHTNYIHDVDFGCKYVFLRWFHTIAETDLHIYKIIDRFSKSMHCVENKLI